MDINAQEMQQFYYKGTRKGMVSCADSTFIYTMGLNTHPNPDKSTTVCSQGIHLAKDIPTLKKLCKNAEEYYLAKAGVIYGEDDEKVRVGYCWIISRLWTVDVPLPKAPICGEDWFLKHLGDHSQEEIDNLKLELITDKSKTTISAGMTLKNIRTALKARVRV